MILVTGGTGFVGQEVVTQLLTLGHPVRLLVRKPQRAGHLARLPQVELAIGDVLHPDTLPAALKGVHAVVHLVGFIAETSKISFEQGHVEATRNVLTAAKQAGVTRWVQMSAAGTRPNAASRYHQTKWQAEELVRHSGLDWTIFRPSLVYGYDERDRLLNLLKLAFSWPLYFIQAYSFPLLNGGEPMIQPVSVREVAHCFALARTKAASIGPTYELVGPVAMTWREMAGKVAAALGKTTSYEDKIPLLLILRILLWLTVGLVPVLVILGLIFGKITLLDGIGFAILWTILASFARRWTTTLLFGIPAQPLLLLGEALNYIAPRSLQFSEQLKMAVEDNVGDPRPAAELFAYEPEPFERGLARLL